MMYKLFAYLSLTSALLTTMNPCFAMEPKDPFEEDKGIVQRCVKADGSDRDETVLAGMALDLLVERYKSRMIDIHKMKDSPEKEVAFAEIIKGLDSLGIENLKEGEECKSMLQFFLAKALKGQGILLQDTKVSLEDRCERLNRATLVFRRSLRSYTATNPAERVEVLDTIKRLTCVLVDRSSFFCKCVEDEIPAHIILKFCSAAFEINVEAYAFNTRAKIDGITENIGRMMQTSLRRSLDICDDICKGTIPDNYSAEEHYAVLITYADHLKKLINFVTNHFLENFIKGEYFKTSSQKQERDREKAPKKMPKKMAVQMTHFFDYKAFILSVWNTHCEALKRAGNFILNFDRQQGAPEPRGPKDLCLAYDAYKEKCYGGEYQKDPVREQTFILARLESLVGNEAPLKKFYADLIQERRECRKRQEQRREQSIAQQIKKEQQEARAQHLRVQEEQANTQQPPKRREEKKHAEENQTSPSEPSLTFFPFDETKPDLEDTPSTKVKTKRHGVADPSKAEKVLRNEPAPVVQNITVLKLEDYQVFLSLIGESHDRSITLDQVIHLLGNGLSCSIMPGGNHRKATAQNGAEWTIPPAWDGPIHSGYRHQLMDFLLGSMELDPAFVRARGD